MEQGVELRQGQRKCSEEEQLCGEEKERGEIHLCAGLTLDQKDGCHRVAFFKKNGKKEKKG